MTGGADEIARIEHELARLRERHALFLRGAAWVRRTFFGACAVLAGLVVWRLILGDFFGAVLAAIMGLIFLLWCLPYRRKRRLTDLLGAREVEEMIFLREKRLAELRRRPA
jgi:hypothetical protein